MKEYDILKAPAIVWHVKFAAHSGIPIGLSTYKEALEKHPEYFQEEIDQNNKWKTCPQEAKDAYYKERNELCDKHREQDKAEKPYGAITMLERFEELVSSLNSNHIKEHDRNREHRQLHDNHFKKYGIKYNR